MTTTKIFVILDRSGSMECCRSDTIGGFNSFVRQQKELKADNAFLSFYQFDNDYSIIYENKKIEEVEPLTDATFVPRGGTALLDAIGRTVNGITANDGENVIVVIITDGEENSSREFNKTTVNQLIGQKKEKGWEFIFLGANQDAIKEAAVLGINSNSSLTYATEAAQEAFTSVSSAISRSRSTPMKNISFTPEERQKSMGK